MRRETGRVALVVPKLLKRSFRRHCSLATGRRDSPFSKRVNPGDECNALPIEVQPKRLIETENTNYRGCDSRPAMKRSAPFGGPLPSPKIEPIFSPRGVGLIKLTSDEAGNFGMYAMNR